MKLHDFFQSLALSHQYTEAPWWKEVYEKAFYNFSTMIDVRNDCQAQREGIDRYVILNSGETIKIDEKVRTVKYNDILLEVFSNSERETPGWMQKNLRCDYIAYAFIPTKTCYLLPFLQLKRAWNTNKQIWYEKARKSQDGFRVVDAENKTYTTHSICVPIDILIPAINEAMVVNWGADND